VSTGAARRTVLTVRVPRLCASTRERVPTASSVVAGVCMCPCMYVCMYVCMAVRMAVCMCDCVCVYVAACDHKRTRANCKLCGGRCVCVYVCVVAAWSELIYM
jgi:hypothetical protein